MSFFWLCDYTSAYKILNVFHLKKNAIECYDKKVKTAFFKDYLFMDYFHLGKILVHTINNNQSYELYSAF